jgi:drug/metabolite transporter (DMT)-like permease
VVVCVKRLSTTEPTRTIMFYYAFWTTVFAILPAAWVWIWPTWTELVLLVAIGLLGISGQACITHGLTHGEATALVPLDYSRILYSAIIGYVLFAEVPSIFSIAGMVLIVGSSLYLVLTERSRK